MIKRLGKVALLCLLCVSAAAPVLWNAYADEGVAPQAKEQAMSEALGENTVTAMDYRQELGKAIVVEEEEFAQELDSRVRFMPLSRAKSQSGKVALVASETEYNYKLKILDKIPLQLGFFNKYIGINNSTAVKLPARLTTVALGAETTLPFFNVDKTYFTIALAPSFFTDNWNFRSESFHLMQRYFMIYQPNEKWTFVLGASYDPGFKPSVSPIAGFIYRPNDKLTFNLIPSNPEISYQFNKRWSVFAEGAYVGDEYKVTQDNLKNVVLNYNEIRTGAGLRYTLNKNIEGSLTLGGVFDRSIEYRQDSLGKVALKNGFYSEFRLSISA